jgi:membrane protease YdiL (CAAX protease family)
MSSGLKVDARVCGAAILVIVPLIVATLLIPPGLPYLLERILFCAWGVIATLGAHRLLFSQSLSAAAKEIGFVRPRTPMLMVALLITLPMWAFLPLLAWTSDVTVALRPDWPTVLLGVVLLNGIAEEVIHRGFVFRQVRRHRTFVGAATISALVFAAQHFYLILTAGWAVGVASVLLAALVTFPLAFVFERNGHSIAGPAILHTSSNAPIMILAMPDDFAVTVVLPHMTVVLVALYLAFVVYRFAADKERATAAPLRAV